MPWNNISKIERLIELKEDGYSGSKIAEILNDEFGGIHTKDSINSFYKRFIKNNKKDLISQVSQEEETNHIEKLSKRLQRVTDSRRIEKKGFRNILRYENFFESYINELKSLLESHSMDFKTKRFSSLGNKKAVVHLTDIHFNELVSLPDNKYDFNIASKRLQKFADKIKLYLKPHNIDTIIVACTGDLINSDRRLDELLSMATVRSQSVFIGTKLLQNFLLDLNDSFNVSFTGVTGNESRIQKDLAFSNLAASDNYDMTIYNMLKFLFAKSDIKVIIGDPNEVVVDIYGYNVLLTHGYSFPRNGDMDRKISDVIAKYNSRNINIRFVIYGHYHSTMIQSNHARGGSLVGLNAFASYNLNYSGRAEQNIHIISTNGEIDSIKIDLQNTEGYPGYNIDQLKEEFLTSDSPNDMFKVVKI